nr:hypothetical protein 27.t00124 [Brassica oleracea]
MARELCLPSFHVETQSGVRSLVLRGVAYRTNFVDSGPFAASRDAATLFFFFFWVDDARRVSFGAGSVFQRRHFLGCGDGEEGGGELSKIYQERRLLGFLKNIQMGSFDAELEIGFKFLVESYISHVEFERPKWIKTTARDTGLFDHLINLWQFKPGPIPGTCDLSILVDFKFNSPLYRQVASMFFKEVATRLMGAFSDRCRLVYGPGVRVDENAFEQRA